MSRKHKTSGASANATAPAPAGAPVFIHSKICLAGAITLRVGVNELTAEQLSAAVAKDPRLDRQFTKLAAVGLIRVVDKPAPAPEPEPPPPPSPPVELAGKTPAELEALLAGAKSADEANAIVAALASADKDPAPVPPPPPV